jgi:hypothetical protein
MRAANERLRYFPRLEVRGARGRCRVTPISAADLGGQEVDWKENNLRSLGKNNRRGPW